MANVTLHKDSSTSGSGTNNITFDWGKNQGRSQVTRTYTVSSSNATATNRLVVRQAYAVLMNNYTGSNIRNVAPESSSQTITFTGVANGKYLWVENNISGEVTSVCAVGTQVIGESRTVVTAFEGGTSTYTYTVTISLPANVPEGTQIVTVATSDSSSSSTSVGVLYTLNIASGATDLTSVTVNPKTLVTGIGGSYKYNNQTVTVNASSRNQLGYTLDPADATIDSVVWESSDTGVATVSSGLVTGVSEGTATITCRVTDTSGHVRVDTCAVSVYEEGTITGDAIKDIASIVTSSTHNITLHNIDRGTLAATSRTSPGWLTGVTIDTTVTPPTVNMTTLVNSGADRTEEIVVTGTDSLLNSVSHVFSLLQHTPSVDDVPCQNIYFSASDTVINKASNTGDYTISYSPSETTQRTLSWELTGGGTNIAILEVDSEFPNRAYIHVYSGADNTPLTLTVTNTDSKTTPKLSATVNVTATYVESDGYLVANPDTVQLAYNDTVNDTTNGAPEITATNMASIDNELVISGNMSNFRANMQGNIIYSTFGYNDDAAGSSPRTETVTVWGTDNGGTRRSCVVSYSQAPVGSDVNADMQISAVEAVYNQYDAVSALKIAVSYTNPFARNVTFTSQSMTIKGTTDTGTVNLAQFTESLSDKTVAMLSSDSVGVYTINVQPTGPVTRFYIRMLATANNSTLTRPVNESWWDGTDVIDEQ